MKDDNQHSYEFPLYDWLTGLNSENEPVEKHIVLYHGKREFSKKPFQYTQLENLLSYERIFL